MRKRLAAIKENLGRLKQIDKNEEIFGAGGRWGGHHYALLPVLGEQPLAEFEEEHGISLPPEYRGFVTTVASGGAGPGYGLIPLDRKQRPGRLSQPFPYDDAAARRIVERRLSEDASYAEQQPELTGCIELAHQGDGWYSVLVVDGEQADMVWLSGEGQHPAYAVVEGGFRQLGFLDWYESWLDSCLAPGAIAGDPDEPFEDPRLVRVINYEGRDLSVLRGHVYQCAGLEELHLDRNALVQLPRRIGELRRLRVLSAGWNKIARLPETVGELRALERLVLNNNEIAALPDSIGGLGRLVELALGFNRLARLPASIGELSGLATLDLEGNQLESLPATLGQLRTLKVLLLAWNRLDSLPESLAKLTRLGRLSLRANRFARLPRVVAELSGLQQLAIDENPDLNLPDALSQISALPALSALTLSTSDLPAQIGLMGGLKKLVVRNSTFHTESRRSVKLPEEIGDLAELEQLSLEGHLLHRLPESIGRLSLLRTLNLNENRLLALPAGVANLTRLNRLHLRSNPLSSDQREQIQQMLPQCSILFE